MLDTRKQIAQEMAARGEHIGAEAEYRNLLADRVRVLGPDHPDTLQTRNNLATACRAAGGTAEAR